jgi:hypothetical protein
MQLEIGDAPIELRMKLNQPLYLKAVDLLCGWDDGRWSSGRSQLSFPKPKRRGKM